MRLMHEFFSPANTRKAAILAAAVTAMATGRIVHGGLSLSFYVPMMFLLMMFVAAAVTAWGNCAGMPGITLDRKLLLQGALWAAALSGLALILQIFWLDPFLQSALHKTGNAKLQDLTYPTTIGGRLAIILWAAGFQTVFLQAAPMSMLVRLTGHVPASAGLCLVVTALLTRQQIAVNEIATGSMLIFITALAGNAVGCVMFAGFGLIPAMLLSAGLNLHLFFAING